MSGSMEDQVLRMFTGLFGVTPDTAEVFIQIGDHEVPLSELSGVLAEVFEEENRGKTPAIPARGSDEYVATLQTVAVLDQQKLVTASLNGLWEDFGWRGVLDLMAVWILQMENSPALRTRCRDMFGVVNLAEIVAIGGEPEYTLDRAADFVEQALAANPEARPHEELAKALGMAQRTADLGNAWLPFIRSAFAAAHQDPYNQRAVFAELFRGPDRTDKDRMIQLGVILGTAAMGVRHYSELQDRFGDDPKSPSLSWDAITKATNNPAPRRRNHRRG